MKNKMRGKLASWGKNVTGEVGGGRIEIKIPFLESYRQLIQSSFYLAMETSRLLFSSILSLFQMEIEAPLEVLIANSMKYIEYLQSLYLQNLN